MQSTYLFSSYQSRINSCKCVTSYLERIQRLDVHMKQCIPHPWYHEDNIQHEYPLKGKKKTLLMANQEFESLQDSVSQQFQ